jgi:hypothetical protein
MKKVLLVALMTASFGAFAQTAVQGQQQQTSSTSASVAAAQNAGNSQTITVAPVTTNVASDLKDQGATAAKTSADAAIEIAKIQAATAAAALANGGTRDLSADQQRALDREAMLEAARIGQTVKNTPGIVLGQLTSSNDTCMGSVSVGGSGPGFSIGVGTTYTDDNCKMLKNSRELWNMGMKAASLALMCKNADNREALELTGFECPQTAKARKEAEAKTAAAQPEVTDPIVRARLGLPELTASAK